MKTVLPGLSRGAIAALAMTCATIALVPDAAAQEDPFSFDSERFAGGVLDRDIDHATRVVGWQLTDRLYFGRRRGDVDDFGFVWRDGDTQWSFTEEGIGWKRAISFSPRRHRKD